jgi:hypothetical protein
MAILHPPVGRCIYCLASEGKFDDEHIIAYALNGDHVLPEASCKVCATKTGKIEQYVTRVMFGALRATRGMRTRRPKKRPQSFKALAEFEDGRKEIVEVPTGEFPVVLMLPFLPEAGFFRGDPDDGRLTNISEWWTWRDHDKIEALCRKIGLENGRLTPHEFNLTRLSQMLAKIGHSQAVAELGIDGFRPLAVDLALGHSVSINHLVGTSPWNRKMKPREESLHKVQIATNKNNGIIMAEIRLFANLGAPTYHVIVGLTHDCTYREAVKLTLPRLQFSPSAPVSGIKPLHGLIKSPRKP